MSQQENLFQSAWLGEAESKKYQNLVLQNHVSSEPRKFTEVTESSFQVRKKASIRLYAYANRLIRSMMKSVDLSRQTFVLLDIDGCMLHQWGSRLPADLPEKTIWTLSEMGPNAITVGLCEDRIFASVGEENYNQIFRESAILFAPIHLRENGFPDSKDVLAKLGGIAMILPAQEYDPAHVQTIFTMSHDLILNLNFSLVTNRLYERNGQGVLFIDPMIFSERSVITYYNHILFEILDVKPMDLRFEPVSKLIDPPPSNLEFWRILKNNQPVNDMEVTLVVCGKPINCVVSCDVSTLYAPPGTDFVSFIFTITTPRSISKQISKQMGNSALLTFENIIGKSEGIRSAIRKSRRLTETDSNTLILGESGVGKDVFAQAIHNGGMRSGKPFIAVNCGALPRDLIASELFGYEGGAFTGARRQGNIGKFELANGGTIFLDEVGELPYDLQAMLLRVIEEKRLTRLGGKRPIDLDVKIISATNANIMELIGKKLFRADLYYRLSTMRLNIPPLRERGEDILLLAEHFIQAVSEKMGRGELMRLSEEAKELLLELPWYGNVRELQNLMESIVQLYPEAIVTPQHILENVYLPAQQQVQGSYLPPLTVQLPRPKRDLLTREEILAALEACDGNKSKAADYLNIARKTLYRNIERLGL